MDRMNLYAVTIFNRAAENCQLELAIWARSSWTASERGMPFGVVLQVKQMPGVWPLDTPLPRKPKQKRTES